MTGLTPDIERVLSEHEPTSRSRSACLCGWTGDRSSDLSYHDEFRAHLAEQIAALVEQAEGETRREALLGAARELPGFDGIRTHGDAARWLRARAGGSQ